MNVYNGRWKFCISPLLISSGCDGTIRSAFQSVSVLPGKAFYCVMAECCPYCAGLLK